MISTHTNFLPIIIPNCKQQGALIDASGELPSRYSNVTMRDTDNRENRWIESHAGTNGRNSHACPRRVCSYKGSACWCYDDRELRVAHRSLLLFSFSARVVTLYLTRKFAPSRVNEKVSSPRYIEILRVYRRITNP